MIYQKPYPSYTEPWYAYDEYFDYCDCPESGSFDAWKGAVVFHEQYNDPSAFTPEYCLVHLSISADSPRLRAKSSKKCRCKFAEVLDIQDRNGSTYPDGTVAYSIHEINDHYFYDLAHYRIQYKKGNEVYADSFDNDRNIECSHGIHFFMHREDAAAYIGW